MRFPKIISGWLLFAILFALPKMLQSQSAAGQINGTITDTTGGVIPGATVTLTNQDTNVVNHVTTNQNGHFTFLNVMPGSYTMTISAKGFKTTSLPPFNVLVNQNLTENQALEVGSTNETVNVSAASEAVMLQSSSSELGSVIETPEVQRLPLNGRNFTQLLILTPGVTPVSTAQGSGISFQDAGISGIPGTAFYKPSIFGQQNRETFFLLDGIVNTDLRGATYGFLPIIDATDEFKVQAHNDSAEYGGVTGGVVNMASKAGANTFHGSVWEFVRNNIFDARNTFSDFCNAARCGPSASSTTPAAPGHYVQNEFGASGGGPILKNKIFFYGAYEGWRYSKPTLTQALVPTPAEINGDFSQSYYTQQLYNPYSTTCSGGKCTVQPFKCDASGNPITPNSSNIQTGGTACNKIPSTMLNSVMQSYMKAYYQQPNSTSGPGYSFNYIENRAQVDQNNSWQIRIDDHQSDKNFGFVRLSQMWVTDTSPITGTTETTPSNYHAYNFGGSFVHLFTQNLILEAHAGALLKPYSFYQASAPNGFVPATSAGFQNVSQYGGMWVNLAAPYTTSNAGQAGISQRGNPVANFGGSLSWIHGNHSIKGGGEYIYQNRLQRNLYQSFGFNDSTTSNQNASKTGNSLASAILGLPASFTAQTPTNAEDYFKLTTWAGYIEDQWKVRPKLTVNIGLRYDYVPAIEMLDHRLANGLDLFNQKYIISAASVSACGSTFSNPCIPNGIASVPYSDHIVFAKNTQQVGHTIKDNFGPRIGFAWLANPNTVIRGGYGIFYDTITARSQYVQNNIEGPTWPWTTGISNQQVNIIQNSIWEGGPGNPLSPITSLEGHFPNPVVAPSPWLTTGGGYVTAPNYKDGRAIQYNLQIQQQLGANSLLTIGYAGSKDTRLDYTGYANAAHTASPAGTPAATIDSLKLMSFAAPTWHYSTSTGGSNYNALAAQYQKRFSSSFNTIVSYTWSKCMDNSSGWFGAENGIGGASVVQNFFNPRNSYGLCGYDITNFATWSTLYTFPFGHGQHWLQSGLLSYIAGGWSMNYVLQARSGQPFNLNVNGDVANISGNNGTVSGYSRPNVAGNPRTGSCSGLPIGQRSSSGVCYFNPSAFSVPSGSFGNMGKMSLRSPAYDNLDFSLVKNTPLHEHWNLELRAEAFNLYNAQIPGTPSTTTVPNAGVGFITTITGNPRELQMGAKITF